MLMMIGPVRFEIAPLNATGFDHGHEAGFAEKPVLGTMPPLEFVGAGPESWTINARLFPHKFGGLGDLERLAQTRASGLPQYMMRGDGSLMGWVVITQVSEKWSYLDARGLGRVIDVTITVQRCQGPSAGAYFSILSAALA